MGVSTVHVTLPCLYEGSGAGRPVQAPGSLHHTSKLLAYRKAGRLGKDVISYKVPMNFGNGGRKNHCDREPPRNSYAVFNVYE